MKYKVTKKYNRYEAGQIVELSDNEASNMFRRGVIEEVKESTTVEKEEKKETSNKSEKKKLNTK